MTYDEAIKPLVQIKARIASAADDAERNAAKADLRRAFQALSHADIHHARRFAKEAS